MARARPLAAMLLEHVDVGEIGEGRMVGDHAREADLLGRPCRTATQSESAIARSTVSQRDARRPVAARQIGMRGDRVDARRIVDQLVAGGSALTARKPVDHPVERGHVEQEAVVAEAAPDSSTKLTGAPAALSAWTIARDSAVG